MEHLHISSPIEVSGLNDDKPYIEMTTRLCWLDAPNLNGVGLSSASEESFKTLIGMPVVAKINKSGTKFGSHEVSIDDNGEIKFNTSAYGVHTEVWVADDEVDIPKVGLTTLPCLFAKSKVWKRFTSVVELIANKLESPDDHNGGLWSSWELQGGEYHLNDNKEKIYDSFTFLSNCLIDVMPAYSTTSKTLSIASSDFENNLCNAYLDDLNKYDFSENKSPKDKKEMSNEEDIIVPNKDKEVSALTIRDLYQKVQAALNPKGWNSNPYYSVWEIFPEDHKILAYDIERDSDDVYFSVSYTVAEDEIVVGEKVETKLSKLLAEKTNVNISLDMNETAKLLSTKDGEIKELSAKNTELSTELEAKTNALVDAGVKIETLQSTVEELAPFKAQIAEIERVKLEAETAEKVASLKKLAKIGGYISDEEVETSEVIKSLIDSLDEKGIKAIIAERVIDKINKDAEKEVNETPIAVSTVTTNARTNIDENEDILDHKAVMSSFLKN